jgi:hypothetical protein
MLRKDSKTPRHLEPAWATEMRRIVRPLGVGVTALPSGAKGTSVGQFLRPRWCEFSIRSLSRVMRSRVTSAQYCYFDGGARSHAEVRPPVQYFSNHESACAPGRIARILPGARVRPLYLLAFAKSQCRRMPGYYCLAQRGPVDLPPGGSLYLVFD